MKACLPANESQRLASLGQYEILDSAPEQEFDDLTFVAAHICQTPVAMISLVDEKRQWFKSRIGIDAHETSRDSAFCAYTILDGNHVLEVQDAQLDPRFSDNPLVTADPHLRFYAGAPLLAADGQPLGSLCVMDHQPRTLTAAQLTALRVLSRAVGAQLELRRQAKKLVTDKIGVTQRLAIAEKSRRVLLSVLEDEKLATRNLRASEERFRQLIENSSDVIVVVDHTGCIGYQSPSAQRILGYKPDEMSRRTLFEIIHEEDREKVAAAVQQALAHPEIPKLVEYRIKHRDGTWRIFQSIGKSMTDSSGSMKFVVNSRDMTESRLLEEKFLRAQRMESIGTLASGVAHDLNNILAPVLMVAGLLKETLLEKREQDMLTMVERSAQRGASIISQLLTFSRGTEGARFTMQPRYLLSEMKNIMRETFPRDIDLAEDVQSDLWNVVADATQLHQVLLNLCVNARDAMLEGGKLSVSASNVELTEKELQSQVGVQPGPYVLIRVSDTGHGIPPAIIERIFDPFFTTKGVGKGTGLGLSTVIGIVKSHKGFVTVSSELTKGTVFSIYLPAVPVAGEPELPVAVASLFSGNGELVLIVDDEPAILAALREILETHRYRVCTAGDGAEAIRVFIEYRETVQMVVTDVMMPVMGGFALVNSLRGIKPGIKIIATTGLENTEKSEEFAALGVTEILAKPFSPSLLLEALAKALTRKSK